MSVDDSGAHPIPHNPALDHPGPLPLPAIRGRDWLNLWGWHARKHPDMWAERERDIDNEARDLHLQAARRAKVPARMLRALRHGDGQSRHDVYIRGQRVQLITKTSREHRLTVAQETGIWEALLRVIDDIQSAPAAPCGGFSRHPELPAEIIVASWDRDGHRYYVCGDGAGEGLRASRRSIGGWGSLAALLHIPSLAALTQRAAELLSGPVAQTASTVAVVGVVATASIAPSHLTDPPSEPAATPAPQARTAADPLLTSQHIPPRPGPAASPTGRSAPRSEATPRQAATSTPPDATPRQEPSPAATPPPAPSPSPWSPPPPSADPPAPAPPSTPKPGNGGKDTPKTAPGKQPKDKKPKKTKKAKVPKGKKVKVGQQPAERMTQPTD
ncbi:hypothetical protein ACGFNU_21745 [Spirillospora sp. NPDC048911]|uniref:hypothetical protein n=1 Tax=Spirillospora sp. NPDC048911 TaxID=3364527 RepID=UPI0037240B16